MRFIVSATCLNFVKSQKYDCRTHYCLSVVTYGPHSNQYSVLCEEDKVHCLHGRDYALSVCRMHPILLQGLLKQMKESKYLISLETHEYESWLLISFTSVKIMSTIPWWRSVHANVMSLINFTPEMYTETRWEFLAFWNIWGIREQITNLPLVFVCLLFTWWHRNQLC